MAKKKAIMLLGLAVLVALMVSVLAYNWLQEKDAIVKSMQTEPIAVAQTDIKWATVLTKDMVKMVPYVKSTLPEGSFTNVAALEGRTLIYPVKTNEPIFESKLAPKTMQGGGVAAVITPKKRAMAVKVDKVVGVSGFIHPGHRVDVLVSLMRTGGEGSASMPITKTILENVLVLAAGTEFETAGSKEKPAQVDVITLEVTPEEGEKLAHAAMEGRLQLALRNSIDTTDVLTKGATVQSLLGSYSSGRVAVAEGETNKTKSRMRRTIPQNAPPSYTVEVIKGGKVSEQTFRQGE